MDHIQDITRCIGRTVGTAAIFATVWGSPMYVIDTYNAICERKDYANELITKNGIIYHPNSIVGAMYPTPYTNLAVPLSGSIGGIGGLVVAIGNIRKRKKDSSPKKKETSSNI